MTGQLQSALAILPQQSLKCAGRPSCLVRMNPPVIEATVRTRLDTDIMLNA